MDYRSYLGPYLLGPNDENQGIYTGDARELATAIPDESVDLIFTDPVYQNIDDYRWLAETAARVLNPDSACLTYFGIGYLPETTAALSEFLDYEWQHISYMPTLNRRGAYRTFSNYRGLLEYMKGRAIPYKHTRDLYVDTYKSHNDGHKWTKHQGLISHYLRVFSPGHGIVFDPFSGGASIPMGCIATSRRWLAFEIDPDTAERARERVRNTQPPLFMMEPEQQVMDFQQG